MLQYLSVGMPVDRRHVDQDFAPGHMVSAWMRCSEEEYAMSGWLNCFVMFKVGCVCHASMYQSLADPVLVLACCLV